MLKTLLFYPHGFQKYEVYNVILFRRKVSSPMEVISLKHLINKYQFISAVGDPAMQRMQKLLMRQN